MKTVDWALLADLAQRDDHVAAALVELRQIVTALEADNKHLRRRIKKLTVRCDADREMTDVFVRNVLRRIAALEQHQPPHLDGDGARVQYRTDAE